MIDATPKDRAPRSPNPSGAPPRPVPRLGIACSVSLCVVSLLSLPAAAQKTCCYRTVATPVLGDAYLTAAFQRPLHSDASGSECQHYDVISLEGLKDLRDIVDQIGEVSGAPVDPESQPWMEQLLDMDYLFRGALLVSAGAGIGDHYTLDVKFFDHHHGETVKQGQVSWRGFPRDGLDAARQLARSFLPLDELMYDHERTPESARLEPERDPIEAGETMGVRLMNLRDGKGREPKPWQRVMVKAEKGKILNGKPRYEYRVFDVGSGEIEVEYEAPDDCRNDTETITVHNSCVTSPFLEPIPEDEITRTSFRIGCNRWKGTITYTEQVRLNDYRKEVDESFMYESWKQQTRTYSLNIEATLRRAPTPPEVRQAFRQFGFPLPTAYDAAASDVTASDSYQGLNRFVITNLKDGSKTSVKHQGSFSGNPAGRLPLGVHLRFNPVDGTYNLDLNAGSGSAASYSYVLEQTSQPPTGSDFVCQGGAPVDLGDAIPDHLFGGVPDGLFSYAPGQTVVEGSHSWSGDTGGELSSWTTPWEDNPSCGETNVPMVKGTSQSRLTWKFEKVGSR